MKTTGQILKQIFNSKEFLWVTLFAIAMGMMESAVVIYIREIYYPLGFSFPLQPTSGTVAVTELIREFATLIMLLAIGILVGKSKIERFAWFLYSFAIWDIFYYVFLYLLIDWPSSLFEWDVLFLLPTMWVGPVWAPVLLSCTMIFLALSIIYIEKRNQKNCFDWKVLSLLISGSLIVITSFCLDFYFFMTDSFPDKGFVQLLLSEDIFEYASEYIPEIFYLKIFLTGYISILAGIILYLKKGKSKKN